MMPAKQPSMQFKPYLQDGVAVQVASRITMPFKTVRPAGVETFDSAQNYFERGRHVSFPAASAGQPYILHATFQVQVAAGKIENGQYVDTWKSDEEWRREATIGKSRFVRARHGEKRYLLSESRDAGVLRMVLKVMEPIPAIVAISATTRICRIEPPRRSPICSFLIIISGEGPQSADSMPKINAEARATTNDACVQSVLLQTGNPFRRDGHKHDESKLPPAHSPTRLPACPAANFLSATGAQRRAYR